MDGMDYVGIAGLFQKEDYFINDEREVYYRCTDTIFGMYCNFSSGRKFTILSGQYKGCSIDFSKCLIGNFKKIRDLCKENEGIYDITKFMAQYDSNIGKYFILDHEMLCPVDDEKILKQIRGSRNIIYLDNHRRK